MIEGYYSLFPVFLLAQKLMDANFSNVLKRKKKKEIIRELKTKRKKAPNEEQKEKKKIRL